MSKKAVKEAMYHKDILGAGARKREKLMPKDKIHAVMGEFKRGTLHSGSGEKVTKRNQAIAIAMSEARKHGQVTKIMRKTHSPDSITPDGQRVM